MKRRLLSWILSAAMIWSLVPTQVFATAGGIGDPYLQMDKTSQTMCIGDMSSLHAIPYDECGQKITNPETPIQWAVDQDGYVMIQNKNLSNTLHCNFYAIKAGTVTITATMGELSAICTVNIRQNEYLERNEVRTINIDDGITVSSDDTDILSVAQAGTEITLTAGDTSGYSRLRFKDSKTGDLMFSSQYMVDAGMVLFDVDGVLQSTWTANGMVPSYQGLPTKTPDIDYFEYVFSGWDPDAFEPMRVIDGTIRIYTAQFELKPVYQVTLPDLSVTIEAGPDAESIQLTPSVLPSNYADYGDAIAYESLDTSIAKVEQNGKVTGVAAGSTQIAISIGETTAYVTVNVTNQEGYVTVTFLAEGWKTDRVQVKSGTLPVAPFDPTERPNGDNCSYRFVEWTPAIKAAEENTSYTAIYQTVEFTANVKFVNWDGSVLQESSYILSATPVYEGSTPVRPMDSLYMYTFEGWDKDIAEITSMDDVVYTAQYSSTPKSSISYTIELSETSKTANIGTEFTITARTEPEGFAQRDFEFTSTDPSVATVTSDGLVKIVGMGTCNIIVSDGNLSTTCAITGTAVTHNITFVVDGKSHVQSVAEDTIPSYELGEPSKQETETSYFVFTGWTPKLLPCTGDKTYTAVFTEYKKVTMQMSTPTLSLHPGKTAVLDIVFTPEVDDPIIIWTTDNMSVATVDEDGNVQAAETGNGTCTITAQYGRYNAQCLVTVDAKIHNITWYVDGEDPYVTQCIDGQLPVYNKDTPSKASDEQYDYTFSGWLPELKEATDNRSYQAQFTKTLREYTVTWVIGDERITETYKYGDTFTPPTNTDKTPTDFETYEFIGWDPSTPLQSTVKGSQVFVAQYLTHDRNNIVIVKTENTKLYVGEHLQLTATVKPSSMAWRWSSSNTSVATVDDEGYVTAKGIGTVSIKASSLDGLYEDSIELTVEVQTYTITWNVDGNKTTEEYQKGDIPSYKGDTEKTPTAQYNYMFIGWDKPLSEVSSNTTYTAQYKTETRRYTIRWDNNGNITSQVYFYGSFPAYKGTTEKEQDAQYSYKFNGWEPAIKNVTGDATYTAKYTQLTRQYMITWVAGDSTTYEMYDYGATPKFTGTPVKAPTNEVAYAFSGWSTPIVPVAGSATYVAQFTEVGRTYTIKWVVDGTETTETYKYDQSPSFTGSTAKASTAQYNYTFTGWVPEVTTVCADATYTAQFSATLRKYSVTFKNWDNTILKNESLNYGVLPTPPATPTRPDKVSGTTTTSYTFKSWSPSVVSVTGDAVYIATYVTGDGTVADDGNTGTDNNKTQYVITFKNWDNTVLSIIEVAEGSTPSYTGDTPTRPMSNGKRYIFNGWSPSITTATKDTTYKATFKVSSATELALTQKEVTTLKNKNNVIYFNFPSGVLYLTPDSLLELAAYKSDIKFTITEKNDIVTIILEKSTTDGNNKTVTDDIPGISYLAYNLDTSNSLEVAPGRNGKFQAEPYSAITKAGGYTKIPGTCRIQESSITRSYSDVSTSSWYHKYITGMYARGLMIGVSSYQFSPDTSLSRAQTLTILYRLCGEPATTGGTVYSDMSPGAWFTKAAMWGTKNQLIPPLEEDCFGFNQAIARKDLALCLYNYANYMGFDTSDKVNLGTYKDAGIVEQNDTTGKRRAAMEWAVAIGIIEGTNSYTLNPDGPTSRAETCAMMVRFLEWAITSPLENAMDGMEDLV